MPSSTAETVRELIMATSDLETAAAKAEDALLAAFRRGEARAFDRVAGLLSEAPRFDKVNLQRRLAWYFENIPSYELGAAQTAYFKGLESYIDNYQKIMQFGERVLAAGRVPSELTTMPEDLIKALVNRDKAYFADLNAAALERLDAHLLDQVVVGASPANALESIRGTIKGSYKWGKRKGFYEWHAGTYARTAQMRFGRQIMKAKADQLELKHFVYVGPIDSKKRPFCLGIVGGAFSEAEIEEMDNGVTGDVMSDGGGYNCRDTWSPVDRSLFEELREEKGGGQDMVRKEIRKQTPKEPLKVSTPTKAGIPPKTATGWEPHKTVEAATKWARDQGLAKTIDFGKLDIETVNAMNNRLAAHLEAFPKLRGKLDFFGASSKHLKDVEGRLYDKYISQGMGPNRAKRMAKAMVKDLRTKGEWAYETPGYSISLPGEPGRAVTFNEAWGKTGRTYIKKSKTYFEGATDFKRLPDGSDQWTGEVKVGLDKLRPQMAGTVKSKFHVPGGDTLESIIDHELGHFMDDVLGGPGNMLFRSDSWDDYLNIVRGVQNSRVAKQTVQEAVEAALSRYGATNLQEFLAEAWCEFLNSPAPREVAKAVGKLLLDAMGGGT